MIIVYRTGMMMGRPNIGIMSYYANARGQTTPIVVAFKEWIIRARHRGNR